AVLDAGRDALLDERDVAPRVRAQVDGVVIGLPGETLDRHRDLVPLLAGHLARLAADAHRRVGEEPHPGPGLLAVGPGPADRLELHALTPARRRYSSTSSSRAGPRGRRPGRMSQVATLYSEMCTLLSSASGSSSLAESPVTIPTPPQWYGAPTRCMVRPCTWSGLIRRVT